MQRRLPLVTFALVALNVAVQFAQPAGRCARAAFVQQYGAIPWELTHNRTLAAERVAGCSLPEIDKSPALSALTSLFVHAGTAHLLGNLLLLLLLGASVERCMGSARFAAFYLVCGYTAAYGFAVTVGSNTQPLIGASGAIAGLLGAHLWLRPGEWAIPALSLPLLVPMPGPALLVGQPGGNVAYTAHLVGLAVGTILAVAWFPRRDVGPHPAPDRTPVKARPPGEGTSPGGGVGWY
ncbi:MAG: rhomboid family intramembrane serine protease [Sporichthyaceae bacterium]